MTRYEHLPAARREIGEYLAYDNLDRKHSSIDDLSPDQFVLLQTGSTTGRQSGVGLSVKPTTPQPTSIRE